MSCVMFPVANGLRQASCGKCSAQSVPRQASRDKCPVTIIPRHASRAKCSVPINPRQAFVAKHPVPSRGMHPVPSILQEASRTNHLAPKHHAPRVPRQVSCGMRSLLSITHKAFRNKSPVPSVLRKASHDRRTPLQVFRVKSPAA